MQGGGHARDAYRNSAEVHTARPACRNSVAAAVEWNEQQRAELARQYARIGYVPGELWPTPSQERTPDQLLELFRRIPDGAGPAGYIAALADAPSPDEGDRRPTNP
jgi:hypothetical protein